MQNLILRHTPTTIETDIILMRIDAIDVSFMFVQQRGNSYKAHLPIYYGFHIR